MLSPRGYRRLALVFIPACVSPGYRTTHPTTTPTKQICPGRKLRRRVPVYSVGHICPQGSPLLQATQVLSTHHERHFDLFVACYLSMYNEAIYSMYRASQPCTFANYIALISCCWSMQSRRDALYKKYGDYMGLV